MTPLKLLVAYCNEATHVATTMEYLRSFTLHSRCLVSYLHVTNGAEIDFDLNEFDAVLNSYCARLCFDGYVSRSYREALKRFRGVRLIAVQDEYDRTGTLRQAIRDLEFDVVLTCVPPAGYEFVYPRAMFPATEFVTVLTGYVPEALKRRGRSRTPLARRPIAIGYRGRRLPAHYGRLVADKFEIGRRMREVCEARGIAHDIETSDDKRIYGDAWYAFLGNCRTTLGTESGSNVFDFDGSLAARYRRLTFTNGREPSYQEFRRYTDPLEDKIAMGQISPRVFEAAALGTPMILFAGNYSGAVVPGEHYIELHKDFDNIEEVLQQVADTAALTALADRAYDHLIASGNYDYCRFVGLVDDLIERKRAEKPIGRRRSPARSRGDADGPVPDRRIDPTALERPTPEPRDPLYLRYRQLCIAHDRLTREFERLRRGSLYELLRARARLRAGVAKRWMVANMPRVATILHRLKTGLQALPSRLPPH
jgi:hypothetical protein